MRRSIVCGVICGILVCGFIAATGADQEADKQPVSKEQQELIDAAHKAYEASSALYAVGAGGVTLEGVYTWSRRWAEAEADGAGPNARRIAFLVHSLRMRQVYEQVATKHQMGANGGEEDKFQAARYYRAEAEHWLSKKENSPPSDQKK